jgi:hypothetical protein
MINAPRVHDKNEVEDKDKAKEKDKDGESNASILANATKGRPIHDNVENRRVSLNFHTGRL